MEEDCEGCQVGQVEGQRIPLLRQIIRTNQKDRSEAKLKEDTLCWVKHHLKSTLLSAKQELTKDLEQ